MAPLVEAVAFTLSMATYPSRFTVGELLIETTTRRTLKVVRLVGSSQVEVQDISFTEKYKGEVMDINYLRRGVANGSIKRIS